MAEGVSVMHWQEDQDGFYIVVCAVCKERSPCQKGCKVTVRMPTQSVKLRNLSGWEDR